MHLFTPIFIPTLARPLKPDMKKTIIVAILLTGLAGQLDAQKSPEVIIPSFNDTYSQYVKSLEAGETDINYKALRENFIESQQFIIAKRKSATLDSLTKLMYEQVKKKEYQHVIATTKQMLSIDYTSMIAHKMLRQTYQAIGDSVNAKKYKTIQFGLLNSIVKNGDGKSCATAWPVIQIEEEYFILQMLGAKLKKQSVQNGEDGICDKMVVEVDGETRTYYFGIDEILEGGKKLALMED